MKKLLLSVLISFVLVFNISAQTNSSVPISDEVYGVLLSAEAKGYCDKLYTSRPYTEKYILMKLDEIHENLLSKIEKIEDEGGEVPYIIKNEFAVIKAQEKRFQHNNGLDFSRMSFRTENKSEKFPVSFEFDNNLDIFASTGVYNKSDFNSLGYDFIYDFKFTGDILKNASYNFEAYIGISKMPLVKMGQYDIGKWWYDNKDGDVGYDKNTGTSLPRTINVFKNYTVLPYSYKKFWDGQAYFLSNLSASGLEGWPFVNALCFGMSGELRASFFDTKLEIGMGRTDREWAMMDTNSSLVLNANASPFLAFDARLKPFSWMTFSTLTGVLEYPNQDYITENAWNYAKLMGLNNDDSYYFQNAFSLIMVELDFKYFHFDFGSSSVWPKRFEFGYLFPFIDNVVYQNNIGDCDNLALFGDMKFMKEGVGSIWISGYLDEMPKLNPKKLFEKSRYMFAFQTGTKVVIPFLPFATLSFRYTKVEPYCYTHHAINYTPWYNTYISESYTNNGSSLGYYLQPNSDEFFLRIETRPSAFSLVALQYQLIRHGADFGSRSVMGSNLYSELPNSGRDDLYKYFLKDGAYEWSNIFTLSGSYDFRQFKVPVTLDVTLGFIYDWFTDIDSSIPVGESKEGAKGNYHKINTSEYPTTKGFLISVGIKAFF